MSLLSDSAGVTIVRVNYWHYCEILNWHWHEINTKTSYVLLLNTDIVLIKTNRTKYYFIPTSTGFQVLGVFFL